jgi:hypothetical protein
MCRSEHTIITDSCCYYESLRYKELSAFGVLKGTFVMNLRAQRTLETRAIVELRVF